MIDLRKVHLLEALLRLPYTFVMPDTLFEDEWLCLTDTEKRTLRDLDLEVRSLPGQLVHRASFHFNEHSQLALNDCFALTLAEEIGDCILLTGDGPLRRIAENNDIEVRGVCGSQTNWKFMRSNRLLPYTPPFGRSRTMTLCSFRRMRSRAESAGLYACSRHPATFTTRAPRELPSIVPGAWMLFLYRAQVRWRPPSTGIVTPVQKPASSDSRKRARSATSSGLPIRPMGWVVLLCSTKAA